MRPLPSASALCARARRGGRAPSAASPAPPRPGLLQEAAAVGAAGRQAPDRSPPAAAGRACASLRRDQHRGPAFSSGWCGRRPAHGRSRYSAGHASRLRSPSSAAGACRCCHPPRWPRPGRRPLPALARRESVGAPAPSLPDSSRKALLFPARISPDLTQKRIGGSGDAWPRDGFMRRGRGNQARRMGVARAPPRPLCLPHQTQGPPAMPMAARIVIGPRSGTAPAGRVPAAPARRAWTVTQPMPQPAPASGPRRHQSRVSSATGGRSAMRVAGRRAPRRKPPAACLCRDPARRIRVEKR